MCKKREGKGREGERGVEDEKSWTIWVFTFIF